MTTFEKFFLNYSLITSIIIIIISIIKIYFSIVEKDKEKGIIYSLSFLFSVVSIVYFSIDY